MLNYFFKVICQVYKKLKNISQNKALFCLFVITGIIFTIIDNEGYAEENNTSKIMVEDDLYIKSSIPIKVTFETKATDKFDNIIPVNCDKTSNSVFELGKTTVRCIAIDSLGNEIKDSFQVTVGYDNCTYSKMVLNIPQIFG